MRNIIYHSSNAWTRATDFISASISWIGIMLALAFVAVYILTPGPVIGSWIVDLFNGG
jgi:hypothetical protein